MLALLEKDVDTQKQITEIELKGYFVVSESVDDFTDDEDKVIYKAKHNSLEILIDVLDKEITIMKGDKSEVFKCLELDLYQQDETFFVVEAEGSKNKYRLVMRGSIQHLTEEEED